MSNGPDSSSKNMHQNLWPSITINLDNWKTQWEKVNVLAKFHQTTG